MHTNKTKVFVKDVGEIKKKMGSVAVAAGILTLISFGLKGVGMLFRVYLSKRMGGSGLGLYQLIMSVYSVFATFASSGFGVAVSRMAAERLDTDGKRGGAFRVLAASSVLALSMGGVGATVLYFGAEPLAHSLVGDAGTASALKVLALSMPFMSLSACLKGYFTALGQIYKPALASLFEQAAKIGITVYCFSVFCSRPVSATRLCMGVVAGLTAGECFSYIFLFVLYLFFSGEKGGKVSEPFLQSIKAVGGVTMPIAASAYVTNLLHSVESVLIPARFVLYGGDRDKALADFGVIRGMSIPLLFFPYAFLGALLSIQVPKVSRLNVAEDKGERNRVVAEIMETTVGFSALCGGFFLMFAKPLSLAVYGNTDAASSLWMLAWVTPFMYVETMADGLLKAIGQQKRTLLYSVINSAFRIVAVLFFIPVSGARGYVYLLMVSNTLSFALCYGRLKKVTGIRLGTVVYKIAAAVAFSLGGAYLLNLVPMGSATVRTVLCSAACGLLYLLCMGRRLRRC